MSSVGGFDDTISGVKGCTGCTDLLIDDTFFMIICGSGNVALSFLFVAVELERLGGRRRSTGGVVTVDAGDATATGDALATTELDDGDGSAGALVLADGDLITLVGILGIWMPSKWLLRGIKLGMDNSFDNIGFRLAFGPTPACWPNGDGVFVGRDVFVGP